MLAVGWLAGVFNHVILVLRYKEFSHRSTETGNEKRERCRTQSCAYDYGYGALLPFHAYSRPEVLVPPEVCGGVLAATMDHTSRIVGKPLVPGTRNQLKIDVVLIFGNFRLKPHFEEDRLCLHRDFQKAFLPGSTLL